MLRSLRTTAAYRRLAPCSCSIPAASSRLLTSSSFASTSSNSTAPDSPIAGEVEKEATSEAVTPSAFESALLESSTPDAFPVATSESTPTAPRTLLENPTLPSNNYSPSTRKAPPVLRSDTDTTSAAQEARLAAFEARDESLRTLEYHKFWHRREKFLKGNSGAKMEEITMHMLRVPKLGREKYKQKLLDYGLISITSPPVDTPRPKKVLTTREQSMGESKLAQRRAAQWKTGGSQDPEEIKNVIASIRMPPSVPFKAGRVAPGLSTDSIPELVPRRFQKPLAAAEALTNPVAATSKTISSSTPRRSHIEGPLRKFPHHADVPPRPSTVPRPEFAPNTFPPASAWTVPAALASATPSVAHGPTKSKAKNVPSRPYAKSTPTSRIGSSTGPAVRSPNSREDKKAFTSAADLPITAEAIEAAGVKPVIATTKPRAKRPTRNDFISRVSEAPVPALSTYNHQLTATSTNFLPVRPTTSPSSAPSPEIATLAHSLDRVLFNPGVHWVRDPRSGVYNFSPSLEKLPQVNEFDFEKLPEYITSSKDEILGELAKREGSEFVSSTSSTTGMLSQIYLWLSHGKQVNTDMLSAVWSEAPRTFSAGQQIPASIIMHHRDGHYAIDADKSMDASSDTNILASLGHLMEKLLTTDAATFSRFLKDSDNPAPSEAGNKQAYHYTKTNHMILRSQLDAQNPHLPNVTFDVKTRGSVAIRTDRLNYEEAGGYLIRYLQGQTESFEKEYYDLIRSAFLKYSFQARIGGMDGCFVAYHSGARVFGFQYIPIEEMDVALFGSHEEGNMVYNLVISFLEKILIAAKDTYEGRSVKLMFETVGNALNVFVEPLELREGDVPVTLLELEGANYVDGVASRQVNIKEWMEKSAKAAIHANPNVEPTPASPPVWTVGYNLNTYDGLQGSVTTEIIAKRFANTRAHQQIFDTIYLPTGVTSDAVSAAYALEEPDLAPPELGEDGTPIEKERPKMDFASSPTGLDLAARFPRIEGLAYVSKIPVNIARNRRLSRQGAIESRAKELVDMQNDVVQMSESMVQVQVRRSGDGGEQ